MSKTQPTPKTRPDAGDDPPEPCCPHCGSERVAASEAERLALIEDAPTTTDPAERPTCPHCGSIRLAPKPGADQSHKMDGYYKCTNCETHLSPPGGLTFGDGVRPADPRRTVIPVEVGSIARYHLADGCEFTGGTEIEAAAAELRDRGLEPCPECAAAAVGECHNCGAVTFGAVEGAAVTVCAACTEVEGDE